MFEPQVGDVVEETGPGGNKLSSWEIISKDYRNDTFTMECIKTKKGGRYGKGASKTFNIKEDIRCSNARIANLRMCS